MTELDVLAAEDMELSESDNAPGGVIVYYADGGEEIIHVNQYVIDLFECDSLDDFLELTNGSFRGFVYDADIDSIEDSIWGQVEKHDNLDHIYYRIKTKTGRLVSIEDFGKLVERPGKRPVFYVFIIEMKRKDSIDWLTGLPSMVRFHELAEMGAASIRERGDKPVAVALDLMGLKAFNTQYGRDEGDKLLCVFADVLRKHFGSEACSRFAEDHYYAFTSESGVNERIEAVFADFGSANEGRVLPVRAGAYICDGEDDIVAIGFDRAKFACDLDKKIWQSHLTWFNDEMREEARLRIHVLANVDRAIEKGWIRPHYQAIVRSSTGYICGEEALARWDDPQYGMLSPEFFVPLLEEAGLLSKLDMYMVDRVIADMKKGRELGIRVVPASVNMSLRDLGQVDIANELAKRADAAGIPHDLLRVEFTESAATSDPELFQAQVKSLRNAGFKVWMDDFGSGYSSLNTLQEYDFDLIKLDMNFIQSLDGERARGILTGVVQVASKLGVDTVAEGVEDESQARFLESIGCDMLQGFYYYRPRPLEEIIEIAQSSGASVRESDAERDYWSAVGMVDISEPTAYIDGKAADGSSLSEFPAGVMERRGDTWWLVRSNRAYREFLDRGGAMPLSRPWLKPNVFERGVDEEYAKAAERSLSSGMWERVAGRMEYGTGLQVYTKHIATSPEADAFLLASVPNMFGTALGTYGDVPVAYAVLRVSLDESGSQAVDAEYVYANRMYCELCGYDQPSLPGRSFSELSGEEAALWLPYCYRAVALGEESHDVLFSPEVGHWLSFNMSPSPVEGCCVYAFTVADDERREREEMMVGRDTSDLIIDITNAFNSEQSYVAAMNRVLDRVSRAIHPDRLLIFEWAGPGMNSTFEWCADGIESTIDGLQTFDDKTTEAWVKLLSSNTTTVISDVMELADVDPYLPGYFKSRGIDRLAALPLFNGSDLIGFFTVDNYTVDDGIDAQRLLETVASFISARMVNQHLVSELEQAGTHDALTGVFNRRGIDLTVAERLSERPGETFVLALIDVDDFKSMNDQYGHDVGDEALRFLARTIVAKFSDDAIIGRNGGDEFLVMLFGDEAAHADSLFQELSQVDASFTCNDRRYEASMSIGYVECPKQVATLKGAYAKADRALYAVKLAGKSSFMRYDPEFESQYRSLLGFSSRDLAEYIPGGIMVHKALGGREILFANDEMISLLECDSLSDFMEFTGGAFDGLALPEDLPRVKEELARQAASDVALVKGFVEYRVRTKAGGVRRVLANSRLADVKEIGKLFYVIFVGLD